MEIESGYLIRELWKNPAITRAVAATIGEYDIRGAHLYAMRIIGGEDIYRHLKDMPKLDRNIEIGKMQINNKTLVKQLQNCLFDFKKEFILQNNIHNTNILETTKDSLILLNKLPTKLLIEVKGVTVEFVCKGNYSSYYRLGNRSIFFDSLSKDIRIKGIDEEIVNSSPFVKKYLKQLLMSLENAISMGPIAGMIEMKTHRYNYLQTEDPDVYRSLEHKNKFLYKIGDDIIESDTYLDSGYLITVDNYKNFVMELMRTVI